MALGELLPNDGELMTKDWKVQTKNGKHAGQKWGLCYPKMEISGVSHIWSTIPHLWRAKPFNPAFYDETQIYLSIKIKIKLLKCVTFMIIF